MQGEDVWGTIYFDEKFIPITDDVIDGVYDWYLISNYGKIYHKYEGKYLKQYECAKNNNGDTYLSVNISTIYGFKSFLVHRLVMDYFYPITNNSYKKLDVNHKNGNKHDNYISYNDPDNGNIERCTRKYNIKHSYDTGLHPVGEDNVHATISNETAIKIIKLLATTTYTSKQICELVGNNTTTHIVDDIRKKQCWTHLSKGYEFHQRINRTFTENDIHNFCKSFQNHKNDTIGINEKCRIALAENGFDPLDKYVETLRKIYTKKYYKNIVSQYIW